jgi:hypothetical protein
MICQQMGLNLIEGWMVDKILFEVDDNVIPQ